MALFAAESLFDTPPASNSATSSLNSDLSTLADAAASVSTASPIMLSTPTVPPAASNASVATLGALSSTNEVSSSVPDNQVQQASEPSSPASPASTNATSLFRTAGSSASNSGRIGQEGKLEKETQSASNDVASGTTSSGSPVSNLIETNAQTNSSTNSQTNGGTNLVSETTAQPLSGNATETNSPAMPSAELKSETLKAAHPEPQVTKKLPSIPVDAPPNLEQSPDVMAASAPPPVTPTENVTLNLINRLVQRGILTKEDAGDLIRQAKEDAQRASQQSQATQQAATQAATAQQMAMEAAAPPSSDEAVSVSYVPEIVKTEMRDEIKRDVMAAAQSEGWAQPNVPEWLRKFRPFMDLRTRYQGNNYGSDNSTDLFETINFNAINTGQPFNMMQIPWQTNQGPLPSQFANIPVSQVNAFGQYIGGPGAPTPLTPPTFNTTQNRQLARVRFRFGADMDLGENFTSGFRVGTGQNGSPVSENQTFGFVGNQGNAQGGNFSSYAIWLDRAFLKYEIGSDPDRLAAITVGRFDNPFYTPTTIMWANDIGFDGVAAQARYKIFKGFTPFATAGIFPIFNTDLNFPANSTTKVQSNDKYLYAAQVGIDWKITKDINFKSSVGYYNFQNVAGKVSSPGVTPNADSPMDTDDTRPTFAQRGNTYMQLRNIQKVDATDEFGNIINAATGNYYYNSLAPDDPTQNYYVNQFQYFGLATPYNILSANARLEYRHWEPFVVSVSGEWDRNLAWNSQNILNNGPLPGPDNNYNQMLVSGPVNNLNSSGSYNGGNTAWIIQGKIGSGALQKRWDWDLGVSYRYVESDAVIDGFCDSDFGGGGTNLKGYAVGGNLALSKSVFIGARWLSATGIAGPTYQADIIQIDINARF